MNSNFRSPFAQMPPITKNLIIINVIMLLATYVMQKTGLDLTDRLALYYLQSDNFRFYQIIYHMFMHG
ncbi:MAG: hypothetical protein KA807_10455 [Prolixibacteraceae bacterium]|nr:hypothetical protein [Prolixibacteraceae bacterium]